MLEKFEEYKRKTQSGWRCINSNTLFGKYIIYMINIYRYVNCILHIFTSMERYWTSEFIFSFVQQLHSAG